MDLNRTAKAGWVRQSETLRRPDLVSHNFQQKKRKKTYKKSIHSITVEDKYRMLQSMKKGMYSKGGTFGGKAPGREPSPSIVVSTDMKST